MSTSHNAHPAQPDPRRWKALALLCTAFFMVILDSAIVVVALPSVDADLAFSAGDLQWVLSAYLLSFGGLLLLGGRAADLLGRRRMLIVGTGLFAVARSAPDRRARPGRCSPRAPRRAWRRRS
jgi:MFS family permease